MEIFGRARTHSGTLTQDKFRTEPQRQYYDALQLLEAGELTPEAFVNVIENAAEKNMAAN
ncbi:hypothetical protein D3C87_1990480 [compost metagenome]